MVKEKRLAFAKLDTKSEEDVDWLDEDDVLDILRGLETQPRRKRRHRGDGSSGGGTIILSPSTISIADTTAIGTTIGTVTVPGGIGTYTFGLVDPSGQFSFSGNQLQVATTLTAGAYTITINGSNGLGDNPTLTTTIYVTHHVGYAPTYPYYGF
jgi:hypothetical protein